MPQIISAFAELGYGKLAQEELLPEGWSQDLADALVVKFGKLDSVDTYNKYINIENTEGNTKMTLSVFITPSVVNRNLEITWQGSFTTTPVGYQQFQQSKVYELETSPDVIANDIHGAVTYAPPQLRDPRQNSAA